MASSIPSQARAVDPFASYNSNTVNTLTRMLTYGEDGIATSKSCDVTLDSTSNTKVVLNPGFVYKDDVWINIESQHVVDFNDSDHYYNWSQPSLGFNEVGYYYIVLEYTYAKSRPAPDAKALIVKPSQTGAYTPGGSWLFLKAVEVEWSGSEFVIVSVSNYDPAVPANRRLYLATYAGTEIGMPTHLQSRDQGRFVYGMEEDDFFFGFSDRWVALGAASGATFESDTSGFSVGDLVYVKSDGSLSLAAATLSSTTADGVVSKVGTDGLIQVVGRVENVTIESGSAVTPGKLIYLSKIESGTVTDQKSSPFSQFVGRCLEVSDSTSVNVLFHRGEPQGSGGTSLAVDLPVAVLSSGGWVAGGGMFYQDVDITNIQERNCVVTVWDATTEMKVEPLDIEFVSDTVLRVWMPVGTEDLEVYIVGPTNSTIGSSYITSVVETLSSGGSWLGGGPYYQDIDVSTLDGQVSAVLAKDTSTGKKIDPLYIQFDSTSNLRIWMPVNTQTLEVTAVGTGSIATSTIALSVVLPSGASWTSSGGLYFQDINTSDFGSDDIVLELYDIDTGFRIEPTDIVFSASNVRVWMPVNTKQLNVTIIG